MARRDPTDERGRIRVTGFDADSLADRGDPPDWRPEGSDGAATGRRARAWARFKRDRSALLGLGIIAAMALAAVFARPIAVEGVTVQPFSLAPYDPGRSFVGPTESPPSVAHPLGTDWAGRDVLSRVLYGGRYSLSIGAITVGLALLIGVPLGAIAGYAGGWVDEAVMRVVDVLYAFPFLVLAVALIAALGQGFWKLILALVFVGWISYARLIRGEILSVKENEYVTAAKALGARDRTILLRHVVPNAVAPVVVQATLGVGSIVLSAAALGFLGLGLEPGSAEWGSMLSRARNSIARGFWWITVFPGLAVFLFVLSINLVGDGLRDAIDPRGGVGRRGR